MQASIRRWIMWVLIASPQLASAASVSDFIDFSLKSGSSTLLPGRLYVPPEAAAAPDAPRPFILFLHGGGESGTNNVSQINANVDNLLAEAKRRGSFLYAPQTSSNWGGDTTTGRVISMLDRAIAEMNVDANRLYITGISNGGGGTWNMLSRYDGRFAAAIPICGVAPAADFVPARLIDDAIAVFHARDDSVVSVGTSRNVVNRILLAAGETPPNYPSTVDPPVFEFASANLDLVYVEPAAGGHGIWPAVYGFPVVYDWLFAHSLAVPEPSISHLIATFLGLILLRRPKAASRLRRTSPSAVGVRPTASSTCT